MRVLVNPNLCVQYNEEVKQSDFFYVNFFSEFHFGESKKFYRKYIDEISKRAYYRGGAKKWFYKLMWRYCVKIPKTALEIDVCGSSFFHLKYRIQGEDLVLTGSDTAFVTDKTGVVYQGININHCIPVKKREFASLLRFAEENEETLIFAEAPIHFNGSYMEIMLLGKYAPDSTNYNKSIYKMTRKTGAENPLIDNLLSHRIDMTSIISLKSIRANKPEYFKAHGGEKILADLERWFLVKIENSIPPELYESLKKIKKMRRR